MTKMIALKEKIKRITWFKKKKIKKMIKLWMCSGIQLRRHKINGSSIVLFLLTSQTSCRLY